MRRLHVVVLVLCLCAAALLFHDFLTHARNLWVGLANDRNGHFGYGQDMAVALEHGDVPQFFAQLEKGKIWPPLHGLFVMVTQILSGNNWRLGVLPSLTGWFLVLWCVYFAAQKIAAPTGLGWAAGLVGLIFAALSPGGRIFATEVMLESLGAGLTMLVFACYACAAEDVDSRNWWRATAIALTALFFEKYNYWMIAIAALVLAEAGRWAPQVLGWFRRANWRALLAAQSREPLNWLFALLAAVTLWLFARGPSALVIHGKNVSLYPPNNLLTATYAVLFVRVILAIRRSGWKPANAQERMLWLWHVLPLAVSFLVPQRLGVFFKFLSPTNNDVERHSLFESVGAYSYGFAVYYCVSVAMAVIAVLLVCVALSRFRKIGRAGRAVFLCLLIGACLNVLHPNVKTRFLHSWLPTLWTASGIGAAVLLERMPRRQWIAGAGVLVLAAMGGNSWLPGAGVTASNNGPSPLDMSDVWLAEVKGTGRVAFCATQGCASFIEWTFLNDDHRSHDQFEWPAWPEEKSEAAARAAFLNWVVHTKAEALVFLDIRPQSPEYVSYFDRPLLRDHLDDWMREQKKFKRAKRIEFLKQGCAVTIWKTPARQALP